MTSIIDDAIKVMSALRGDNPDDWYGLDRYADALRAIDDAVAAKTAEMVPAWGDDYAFIGADIRPERADMDIINAGIRAATAFALAHILPRPLPDTCEAWDASRDRMHAERMAAYAVADKYLGRVHK